MITVLWEEQWLSTLQDLHSDVLRRINILKEEAARVAANSTLTSAEKNKINAAKYSAIMTPIVVALERRLASTSREPRTPHETWFRKEYNAQLRSAITSLKVPPGSPAALGEIWRPFDSVAASLVSHQRKSCVLLSEIAPQLATLSTSDIPMPGFEKQILDSSESFFAEIMARLHYLLSAKKLQYFLQRQDLRSSPCKDQMDRSIFIFSRDGRIYVLILGSCSFWRR